MKKYLLVLLIGLAACSTSKLSFAPAYDASVVQTAQAGMNYGDSLYSLIISSEDKHYTPYTLNYLQEKQYIDAVVLADSIRPKAEKLRFIAQNLKSHFEKYEQYHKDKGVLTKGEAIGFKNDLHAFWQPLLVAEQSLTH